MRTFLKRTWIYSIATTLSLASGYSTAAQYYKWVDESGTVHYSENPPAKSGDNVVKINIKTGKPDSGDKKSDTSNASSDQPEKVQVEETLSDVEKRNQEIIRQNCDIHRANLKTMQRAARIRVKNEDGEYSFISEEEKQAKMKAAQEYISKHCQQ